MQLYTIEQAANALSLHQRTLRRYDSSGKFVALRHTSGRLYYTYEMIQDYLNGDYDPEDTDKYTELPKSAISIEANTELLPVIKKDGERVTYYKLINSDEYESDYNVLKVTRPLEREGTICTFEVGDFNKNNEFIKIFSWRSLER